MKRHTVLFSLLLAASLTATAQTGYMKDITVSGKEVQRRGDEVVVVRPFLLYFGALVIFTLLRFERGYLRDGGGDVGRLGRAHGLYFYACAAAYLHAADAHLFCVSAHISTFKTSRRRGRLAP